MAALPDGSCVYSSGPFAFPTGGCQPFENFPEIIFGLIQAGASCTSIFDGKQDIVYYFGSWTFGVVNLGGTPPGEINACNQSLFTQLPSAGGSTAGACAGGGDYVPGQAFIIPGCGTPANFHWSPIATPTFSVT